MHSSLSVRHSDERDHSVQQDAVRIPWQRKVERVRLMLIVGPLDLTAAQIGERVGINPSNRIEMHRLHAMLAARELSPGTSWDGVERRRELSPEPNWKTEFLVCVLFAVGLFAFGIIAPHLPALGAWVAP